MNVPAKEEVSYVVLIKVPIEEDISQRVSINGVSWGSHILFGVNTLRPRQNGHYFPDDIFKWISLNENVWIANKISLKFVPGAPINNIPALVQIMAWQRPSDKPLSEPMMVSILMHICITQPQRVNKSGCIGGYTLCSDHFLPEASFGLRVLSLPACMCVCSLHEKLSWPLVQWD